MLPQLDVNALIGSSKLVQGQSLLNIDRVALRTLARSHLGIDKTCRVCVSWSAASDQEMWRVHENGGSAALLAV